MNTGAQLAAVIVILLAAVVMILVLNKTKGIISDASEGDCAAAVREANIINKVYGHDKAIDIKRCQTRYLTIDEPGYDADKVAAQRRIQHTIAEQMRQCWNEWGGSSMDLFDEEGTYCHVCSRIGFSQAYDVGDINGYLASTDAYRGKTYLQLLSGSGSDDIARMQTDFKVGTDEDLVVLYTYTRSQNVDTFIQKLNKISGGPSGTAAIIGVAAVVVVGGAIIAFSGPLAPVIATYAYSTYAAGATVATLVPTGTVAVTTFSGAALAANTGIVASAVATTASVSGASSALGYSYARSKDDWTIASGIYLIPAGADNIHVKGCEQAASVTVSP